jgi:hypothetical protein
MLVSPIAEQQRNVIDKIVNKDINFTFSEIIFLVLNFVFLF